MNPEAVEAQIQRGREFLVGGRYEQAAAVFGAVRDRVPDHPGALFGLGLAFQKLRRWEAAEEAYRRAALANPGHADACNNRGIVLETLGRRDEAAEAYRQAVAAQPGHAEAWGNLGNALKRDNRMEESIAAFRRAVEVRPDFAEGWSNLGGVLKASRRFDEARACYQRAVGLKPGLDEGRFNEGILDLIQGLYPTGWIGHEYRWSTLQKGSRREFKQPLWLGGEALEGRTILLHAEQGLGDTLQFVRYAPLVAGRGASVVLEVQRPLLRLMAGYPGTAAVVARGDALPAFDLHCPLLSLPLAFDTRMDSIPAPSSYVRAPAESIEKWRWVAGAGMGGRTRRIGIVWAGNPRHANDRNRSLPAAAVARLFELPDVKFFSLQVGRGGAAAAAAALPSQVTDLAPDIADFSDTAGILAHLDGVVAVDTSVAHLAGAMGVPTHLLLPYDPDWRWLLDRSDSPWYPSLRLHRQPAPGEWGPVIAAVAEALSVHP